mgnify:CR=1 FL=1
MGQSRKSQDAVEAIRLQDRVIEKSIRPPPVGRFGAGRTVFPLLIFYLNPVPGIQSYSKIFSDMI